MKKMTQRDWLTANGYYDSHCCNNCAFLFDNSVDDRIKEGEAYCNLMKEEGVKDCFMDIDDIQYYKCNRWFTNGM